MPRAEVGTPKYIANKMKAKGLQKLRWYCQMCQKQCRDENGFKCHTMSESHQRQLLLFADNSRRYIDEFSYDFAKGYLQILRRQFGSKRVSANRVYQEYIADRHHIHMNATKWVTLGGFVRWMGATGKCIIDETEKGWFITYIEKDPETIAKEERKNKKLKMDKDDEERTLEFVENQVKLAQEKAKPVEEPTYSEFVREDEEPLKLDLKLEQKKPIVPIPLSIGKLAKTDGNKSVKLEEATSSKIEPAVLTNVDEASSSKVEDVKPKNLGIFKRPQDRKRKNALDEIMEQEEKNKEEKNRKDYWLTEGIIVKIIVKSLGEEFYKQKGVIKEVTNKYIAVVKLLESGKKLKLDQAHLETVIPAIGGLVKVVNGAYRGETATLLGINQNNFCASVEIACGPLKGRKIEKIEYEDICKLADH